jgi:hypothetical protein
MRCSGQISRKEGNPLGGGPSREERAAQERLRQQETQAAAREERLLSAAERPDPLAERQRSRILRILDWDEGTGSFEGRPRNVEEMPGIEPYLDLYRNASERSAGERMGRGVISLGTEMQNPELAGRIREQQDVERQQQAAGQLEGAVTANLADATGSVLPYAQLEQSRAMNLANMASGNAASARDAYIQMLTRPRRPGFLSQLAMGMVGGLSSVAQNPAMMAAL